MTETPSQTILIEFMAYNNWANQQVLKACQALSEAQLAAEMPGAFGTIRDTLEHIFACEVGYLHILTGTYPKPAFKWADKPSLTALAEYALQLEKALMDAAQHVSPTHVITWDEDEDDSIQVYHNALGVFIQIINHGVEHRTNITTILNQATHQAPGVDGWNYVTTHPARFDLHKVKKS